MFTLGLIQLIGLSHSGKISSRDLLSVKGTKVLKFKSLEVVDHFESSGNTPCFDLKYQRSFAQHSQNHQRAKSNDPFVPSTTSQL